MSLFRPRIIPVVLIDESGQAVKTINFKKRIYLGDPVNIINIFGSFQVDELILLDIDATSQGRLISLDILEDIASEAKMPFAVGGGIRSISDIDKVLSLGAEKVILSDAVFTKSGFLKDASNKFGASTISVCINIKRTFWKTHKVYLPSSKSWFDWSPFQAAEFCETSGAGEIIVQSIDNDGCMSGYDPKLYQELSSKIGVPIVALGGVGKLADMISLYHSSYISAFAAGSMFVFGDKEHRGVLVNYPEISKVKSLFGERNIS